MSYKRRGDGQTDFLPPPLNPLMPALHLQSAIHTGTANPTPCFNFPSYKGQDHCGHLFLGVPKHLKVQEGMLPSNPSLSPPVFLAMAPGCRSCPSSETAPILTDTQYILGGSTAANENDSYPEIPSPTSAFSPSPAFLGNYMKTRHSHDSDLTTGCSQRAGKHLHSRHSFL